LIIFIYIKTFLNSKYINYLIPVIALSIIIATLNIFHLIIWAAQQPINTLNLLTGHYYSDYLAYVQIIIQGMRGHWMVDNPYSTTDPSKTLLVWGQYLLYGKLAYLLNLSPFLMYWLLIFIFSLLFCLLSYYLINKILVQQSFRIKILAFLVSVFAAPFWTLKYVEGQFKLIPFDYWYAPSTYLYRFGGIPHHLLGDIFAIIFIIIGVKTLEKIHSLTDKKILLFSLVLGIIIVLLLTFYPYHIPALITGLIAASFLIILRNKYDRIIVKKIIYLLIPLLILVVPAAFGVFSLNKLSGVSLRAGEWDKSQIYYPSIILLLLNIGPILIFVSFGIKEYFKTLSPLRLFLLVTVVTSYIFVYTPLAYLINNNNLRFENNLLYYLLGSLSILGVLQISKRIKIMTPLFIIGYLLITLPINIHYNNMRINDANVQTYVNFLPINIYEAFQALKTGPSNGVLTSPTDSYGLLIPLFADKKVFLGRPLFTDQLEEKKIIADNFFLMKMSLIDSKNFLNHNNIKYIFITNGNSYSIPDLIRYYPFLRIYYQKDGVTILET